MWCSWCCSGYLPSRLTGMELKSMLFINQTERGHGRQQWAVDIWFRMTHIKEMTVLRSPGDEHRWISLEHTTRTHFKKDLVQWIIQKQLLRDPKPFPWLIQWLDKFLTLDGWNPKNHGMFSTVFNQCRISSIHSILPSIVSPISSLVVKPTLWKIRRSVGISIPSTSKNRNCSKPPTSK